MAEEKTEKSGEKTPETANVSRETLSFTPYMETNDEKAASVEINMFTPEQRRLGNERSVETNKNRGEIMRRLELVADEFLKISALLEKADSNQALATRLYVTSRFISNRRRLIDSLIDLAAGVCVGTIPDPEDSKKPIRVYTEKPSYNSHVLLAKYMQVVEDNDKLKKSPEKTTNAKTKNSGSENSLL